MRSAGIVQRAATKLTSFQVASMNSDLRTPVSRMNLTAERSVGAADTCSRAARTARTSDGDRARSRGSNVAMALVRMDSAGFFTSSPLPCAWRNTSSTTSRTCTATAGPRFSFTCHRAA